MSEPETLFSFPAPFSIKVVGHNQADFEPLVVEIVTRHAILLEEDLGRRLSGQGRYLALTLTIAAESREQLDNIYRELHATGRILMSF